MNIPHIKSINTIQLTYSTGERPVLVDCDDLHSYVCKYRRSTAAGYKLAGELIGSVFATLWEIPTPSIALVDIRAADQIVSMGIRGTVLNQMSFGSLQNPHVIDVTHLSKNQIPPNARNWQDLLKISFFDLWLSNEDRNSNNANLLYDIIENNFVAIDHGCIFNTASFGDQPYLLTFSESIINSDLARYLSTDLRNNGISAYRQWVDSQYSLLWNQIANPGGGYIEKCSRVKNIILDIMPNEWVRNKEEVAYSLECVFDGEWVEQVARVSYDYLMESILENE